MVSPTGVWVRVDLTKEVERHGVALFEQALNASAGASVELDLYEYSAIELEALEAAARFAARWWAPVPGASVWVSRRPSSTTPARWARHIRAFGRIDPLEHLANLEDLFSEPADLQEAG